MGRMEVYKTVNRKQIVHLLNRLPGEDAAGQFRTASELAWIGIQARKQGPAVRGRLNAAARGRVGATYFRQVLTLFESLSMPVRREMALALGDLAGSVAVSNLIRLASTADDEARLIAVDALGKIGGPRAVTALKRAASDTDEAVRAESIRSLGQLAIAEVKKGVAVSNKVSVETLLLDVSAADSSEYVRQVAGSALEAMREVISGHAQEKPARISKPTVSVST